MQIFLTHVGFHQSHFYHFLLKADSDFSLTKLSQEEEPRGSTMERPLS